MSPIERRGETFQPPRPTLAEQAAVDSRPAAPSLKVTGGALAIVLIVNALAFILYWIPELQAVPLVPAVMLQIAPLVSPLLTGASHYVPVSGVVLALTTLLAVVTTLTWFIARTRNELLRLSLPIMGTTMSALSALLLVLWISRGWLGQWATGLVLLVVLVFLGIRTVVLSRNIDTSGIPELQTTAGRWLTPYLVTLIGPFAVGRMLVYGGQRDSIAEVARCSALTGATMVPTYATWHTVLLVATGAGAGLLLWALIRLLPPWSGRNLTSAIVALVLAVGPGLAMARPAAVNSTPVALYGVQQYGLIPECAGW